MTDRETQLEDALRAFMRLDWAPDAAPGPSYYMVSPVNEARKAMQHAGVLLDGKSPFPSDNDGSVMVAVTWDEWGKRSERRSVWLGGMNYDADQRSLVPEKYLAMFDGAMTHKTAE